MKGGSWDDLPEVLTLKILTYHHKLRQRLREGAAIVFQKYIKRSGPLFAYKYAKAVRGIGNRTLREVYLETLRPLPQDSPAFLLRLAADRRRQTKAFLKLDGY